MQTDNHQETESLPTMAEIVRGFNNTCNHHYPDKKRPTLAQRIEMFNEVTGGGWSVEFKKTSDLGKSGPSETIRSAINTDGLPNLEVRATVTVLTRDGMITREGVAKGPDDGPDADQRIGQQAFIRAVITLAHTALD